MFHTLRRLARPVLFATLLLICTAAYTQTTEQKKVNYNVFLQQYHAKAHLQLHANRFDTFVHPYAVIAAHFVKEKVYPDKDALELLQALNPTIKMDNPNARINTAARFITPHYTQPTFAVLQRFNAEYIVAAAPDPETNAVFANTLTQFNRMIEVMAQIENPPYTKGMWDSLTMLNKYAFPVFSQHAAQISKTQIVYINNDVRTLIRLFGYLNKEPKKYTASQAAEERKSFIVHDLFDLSNISSNWTGFQAPANTQHSSGLASYSPSFFTFSKNMATGSLADRPFKCNVYVFSTSPDKSVPDSVPVPERYYLWLGDKASFDDLIPGCDSSSIGFPKNGNLASTLPVAIGFGSYIIIIKDRLTGVVLTKEVSITSETEFEQTDDNTRKIIFRIN